ncbi:MAG: kinase [Chlamydiia bacterium]|nr:kinase [Chlamydiia bacterium]
MIISRTPIRLSFFGGGTDYPLYYHRHPGAVLGTTINQYTHVSLKTLRSPFFEYNYRIAYSCIELVDTIDDIIHPSIRECLKYTNIPDNLEINIFSDLPARTGLGSSSSFTVGFLNALYALQGTHLSKQHLAEKACFVEQELIGERVGSQDQFHATFGGLNLIEFKPEKIICRPLVLPQEKKDFLESQILLFYTQKTRQASEIVKEQLEKTIQKQNDQLLDQMYTMVFEAEEILTHLSKKEMIRSFGQLLHKSWNLKKQLSNKISLPFIDEAYHKALEAGAYGGKLCGAGQGGFLALVVPFDKQNQVRQALASLPEIDFRFENKGSTIIYETNRRNYFGRRTWNKTAGSCTRSTQTSSKH